MRHRISATVLRAALAAAIVGCGGTREPRDDRAVAEKDSASPKSTSTSPVRGVATIRAELAQHCTGGIGTRDSDDPATEEVTLLVDEFVAAYTAGPRNASSTGIAQNVLETMEGGCGRDEADKIRQALGNEAQPSETPTREPESELPGVGDSVVLAGEGGARVRVKVLRVIDPLFGGEFDETDPGGRFVGVELQMTNVEKVPYSDSPSKGGAVILYGDDDQVGPTGLGGGPCSDGFASSGKLRPGARRRRCIPFALSNPGPLEGFQFALDSGSSDDLGEWNLR